MKNMQRKIREIPDYLFESDKKAVDKVSRVLEV